MGADQGVRSAQPVVMVARPAIICRVACHARAYRVQLDVAVACQAVAVGVDQRRFETAFPECAGAVVVPVDGSDEVPPQVTHHP